MLYTREATLALLEALRDTGKKKKLSYMAVANAAGLKYSNMQDFQRGKATMFSAVNMQKLIKLAIKWGVMTPEEAAELGDSKEKIITVSAEDIAVFYLHKGQNILLQLQYPGDKRSGRVLVAVELSLEEARLLAELLNEKANDAKVVLPST